MLSQNQNPQVEPIKIPPIKELYILAVLIRNDMYHMHLYSEGNDFEKAHALMEKYTYLLNSDIDFIAELAIERNIDIPNSSFALSNDSEYQPQTNTEYTYQDIIRISRNLISKYLVVLNSTRDSIENSNIQSSFDEISRDWEKELNYKLYRTLDNKITINSFINTGLDTYIANTLS